MAKLYFRYGAMGSSKTANAIMVQYNYHERGQNALMLKPMHDNRDGERIVGSRSGLSAPCAYVEELDRFDLSMFHCIIVDEAQFLKKAQVERLVEIVDQYNIPVICYGLRADFQGNLFEGSQWLMAWADTDRGDQDRLLVRPQGDVQRPRGKRPRGQVRRADPAGRQRELRRAVPPPLVRGRACARRRSAGLPRASARICRFCSTRIRARR